MGAAVEVCRKATYLPGRPALAAVLQSCMAPASPTLPAAVVLLSKTMLFSVAVELSVVAPLSMMEHVVPVQLISRPSRRRRAGPQAQFRSVLPLMKWAVWVQPTPAQLDAGGEDVVAAPPGAQRAEVRG